MEIEKAPEVASETAPKMIECEECGGLGEVECSGECGCEVECPDCGGTGEVEE